MHRGRIYQFSVRWIHYSHCSLILDGKLINLSSVQWEENPGYSNGVCTCLRATVNFWAIRANNCKICCKQGSSVTFTRIINTVKAGYHSDDRLHLLAHHASLTWNGPISCPERMCCSFLWSSQYEVAIYLVYYIR